MVEYIVLDTLFYTRSDTWVCRTADGKARIGITDYAQKHLGPIEFVGLPEKEDVAVQFESFGEIESMKSLVEPASPISGTVTAINKELENEPGLINNDPYGKGWIAELACEAYDENTARLMTADAYRAYRQRP